MLGRRSRNADKADAAENVAQVVRGSPGKRLYAIGDVHGRLDLLDELFVKILKDARGRPSKPTFLVMLGDLIDRGPDSRGVIERIMSAHRGFDRVVNLTGNHEEMMRRGLSGEPHLLKGWLDHGGYQCAQSYGVSMSELLGQEVAVIEDILQSCVPREHLEFLAGFSDSARFGDYLLVHAGIRPGVSIDQQSARDMRWIRGEFLESAANHGVVVIHGHTVTEGVTMLPNRIGIDTGAYKSGLLTAIRIEDDECEFIQASRP